MTFETTTVADSVELKLGELRLALRPDLGGAVAGLWFDDLEVMRSVEPSAIDTSRQAASYPLVPYSNRLGYRRFQWHGKAYTTQPNFDDSVHSVHGVGWLRPWTVVESDDTHAVLRYTHPPDAHWPFPFEAEQRFELADGAATLTLSARNTGTEPAPMGLGWHPYFPKRSRSRVHAELSDRWESDATGLPTRKVPQPGIDGDVSHLEFDHCFDGWNGTARIRDEKLSVRMTSSLRRLVVYTPQSKEYFAVEPVSHVSNALHMADPAAHGLVTLAPGESMTAWMKLEVSRP